MLTVFKAIVSGILVDPVSRFSVIVLDFKNRPRIKNKKSVQNRKTNWQATHADASVHNIHTGQPVTTFTTYTLTGSLRHCFI